MITARRMRERIAAEASGKPPPLPSPPTEISYSEHVTVVQRIKREHADDVGKLRVRIQELEGKAGKSKKVEQSTESEAGSTVKVSAGQSSSDKPAKSEGKAGKSSEQKIGG
jgi:hypothetical protein